jgi:hypothetical protein
MKKTVLLFFLAIPLFGNAQRTIQKRLKGEVELTQAIMKECRYTSLSDSIHILETVQLVHRMYNIRRVRFVHNGTGSSHFVWPSRTMHLFVSDSFCISDLWMGELPHAKQFTDAPLRHGRLAVKGFFQAFFEGFFLKKKERKEVQALIARGCPRMVAWYWVSYRRQYSRKGSLEYQAHKIDEPMITPGVSFLLLAR